MSKLLEILGRAITVDTADLIWHWLDTVTLKNTGQSPQPQRLNEIIEAISTGKLQTAEEQLKLYLFENPSCTHGRMAAAAICLDKNQLHKAIEQLNSVYMRQPNNTMALYALGHCYERLGKESEAVEFYQDCLKFKNYLQLPRQRLAAIYFKNAQLEKTILEYKLLRDEYPDDISTLITLGYLYIAGAEYAKAIETLDTAILMHPDNFNAENKYIDQLIADGQLQEAAEQLENMLSDQPESADLILKQADVLTMLGEDDEATSQYEKANRICPDFLEAAIKLGTQYLRLNCEKLASQQFNRAVEINDQIVDAYIGLATAHKAAGDTSDAMGTLSLAVAIDANSSLLFAEAATLQFKTGFEENLPAYNDSDSADLIEIVITAHRRQIKIQPQNPDLHYRLGILMTSIGRTSDAVKSFRTALTINPAFSRARNKLVVSLFETEQKKDALQKLGEYDCLDKDTLGLHYKTSLLYCDRIKFASSLINLERYMENNFTAADATVNISIVLQNLGLLDRTAITWENLSDMANQATNTNDLFPPDKA